MSSNRDRISVLEGFQVAPRSQLRRWTDRQLDEALLAVRQREESQRPGVVLDFYDDTLGPRWRKAESEEGDEVEAPRVSEPELASFTGVQPAPTASGDDSTQRAPVNLILYGPPGTGKTHWLRQKFAEYTDAPSQVDPATWLNETLTNFGWRSVIAAALADIGRNARVPELRAHRWVQAKAQQRGRAATTTASGLCG